MRIGDEARNCIAYLYASEEEAVRGGRAGATGFFVYVPSPFITSDGTTRSHTHVYLVTNDHVRQRTGELNFVRVNTRGERQSAVFSLGDGDWQSHPSGDDVAVCYLGCDPGIAAEINYLSSNLFVTRQHLAEKHVGLGDDCLMIGRFALHPGTVRNLPVVRFGNISMLPEEGVRFEERGHTQEAFLVEMRSRAGFSGSPVFLLPQLEWQSDEGRIVSYESDNRDLTLGIVCGHFSDWTRVRARMGNPPEEIECQLKDNSGMAIVIPAWRIQEILDMNELREARQQEETKKQSTKLQVSSTCVAFLPR